MKRQKKQRLLGWLIVLGFLLARSGAQAGLRNATGFAIGLRSFGTTEPFQNKELEQFFKVKTLVFSQAWDEVRSGMERYLKNYPFGKMRDEAFYWLAQSFDRLAEKELEREKVIALKKSAMNALERLLRDIKESAWLNDVREFRVRIAGQLALLGEDAYKKIVVDALETQKISEAEVKMTALKSLAELNSKTSLPVLKRLLQTEKDALIRKQIVSLLARRPTPEVMEILKDAARDDRDDDVRKEAASWIERINIRRIPVQLNYYVFEAGLTDASEYSKAPEGKTAVFFIPRDSSGGETAALMGIGRFFNKRIVFTGSKATSLNAAERYEFTKIQADSFTTSHRIAGFNIALDEDSIKKTTESIEGRIFIDGKASPFKVDDKNSILMAARRGDRLAVMVLEMRPKDSPAGEGGGEPAWIALPDDFTLKMNPVYYSVVHTMGIVVNSTRRSMDLGSVNTDIDDFLLAKAEIPGPRGTWTLTGYILLLKKESMLVGRMAKLVKPDGTIAAEGDEIRVPIKDPAAFTMTGGKIGTAKEKPGGIGLFPVLTVEGGVQIFSSGMNLTGDALDCGQSRATIPGPGGIWTLSGRLVFMKGDRRFVAKDAELKNSQGKVVAQGAVIAVPIQNPEKFTLEKERSD